MQGFCFKSGVHIRAAHAGAGHCDVLAAAEVAVQRALREYTAAMQDLHRRVDPFAGRVRGLVETELTTVFGAFCPGMLGL